MMTRKIILQGGYGGHDSGDEAQLTTPLIYLKKFIPDADFLALSYDPRYTSEFHKVESDYWLQHYLFAFPNPSRSIIAKLCKALVISLRASKLLLNAWLLGKTGKTILLNNGERRLLNILKDADLLFNVGGGNLNSLMRADLYGKGLTYLVCKILDKPVILSGQSIGPFNGWLDKRMAKFTLNKVNVITLRDATASVHALKDIGVTKPIIRETADDAILLPAISQEEANDVFLKENIEQDSPLIGINLCGSLKDVLALEDHQKIKKVNQTVAEIADYLISEFGAKVVFIPMDYNPVSDDRVAASEVLELMQRKDKARLIMNEHDDCTLKGIIGQLDLAVGFRYHFIVFATTMQVPVVGLYLGKYYEQKIKGILKLMEQEKYAVDLEKTTTEEIIGLAEEALLNKDSIAKKLGERTKILGQLSLFTVKYAAKLLQDVK